MTTKYEALTDQFISDMEAVGGTFATFVDALDDAWKAIRERHAQAADEQRVHDEEGP